MGKKFEELLLEEKSSRIDEGLTMNDLKCYKPIDPNLIEEKYRFYYLGYFLRWTPQEMYYYAVEKQILT